MKTSKAGLAFFSLIVILSMLLASCQPAAPTPERIIETVMVEGTPEVHIITATPGSEPAVEETPAPSTAFLPAESMVECRPFPEGIEVEKIDEAASASAKLARLSPAEQAAKSANQSYFGKQSVARQEGGNVYRVGVFEDVTSLNFFAANGPDNTVWNAYMLPPWLSLYTLTDKYFTLVPMTAAKVEIDPLVQEGDFWVASIPMRQDIQWSDGTPFTAKDVAFTANTVVKFGIISGNFSQWYDGNFLDHAEAVDDYTVKFYYHTKPGMARHEFGVLQAPILNAAYWEPVVNEAAAPIDALPEDANDEQKSEAQAAATEQLMAHVPEGEPTAGAYLLQKWEQGAFIDTSANPDFFLKGLKIEDYADGSYADSDGNTVGSPTGDPELTIEVGPHADAVVYTVYGSQDAAILALKNGEVDFVLNSLGLQRGLANQIRNDPNLTVLENPVNGFRYMSFNVRRRPMNDCTFRQAVGVLIDKEFVTNTILQGAAFPFYTYVAEGNSKWFNPNAPKLGKGLSREERLNAAIAMLEGAGYTWEGGAKPAFDAEGNSVIPGGRLVMPDGTPVPELQLWAPSAGYDPLRSTFAIWIETWLNEVGIPVKAELAGFNVLIPRIFTEQDFDMYILGWSLSNFPASLRDFFSEESAAPGGNNAGGYISQQFEDLSNKLLVCPDYESCKPIADELQVFLATESPYVVLFDTGILEAYRSASIEFPFTEQLSGLQYTHQATGGIGLQAQVKIK